MHLRGESGKGCFQRTSRNLDLCDSYCLNVAESSHKPSKLARGAQALRGFALFTIICAFGYISNIVISALPIGYWIFSANPTWWLAGACGAVISAVWNSLGERRHCLAALTLAVNVLLLCDAEQRTTGRGGEPLGVIC
jgi:hypothetical protein